MRSRLLGSLLLVALALLASSCSHQATEPSPTASAVAKADGLALAVQVEPRQLQPGQRSTATVTLRNDSDTAYRGTDGWAEVWYSRVRDSDGEQVSGTPPTHVALSNMTFNLDPSGSSSDQATLDLKQPGEYQVQALYTSGNGHVFTPPVLVTVSSP